MLYTIRKPGVKISEMSELETENETEAYCKTVTDASGVVHYYIRSYRSDKSFFDKEDTHHYTKFRIGSMVRVGDPYFWQKSSKTIFDTYCSFLKTGNRSFKRDAERLMQNG